MRRVDRAGAADHTWPAPALRPLGLRGRAHGASAQRRHSPDAGSPHKHRCPSQSSLSTWMRSGGECAGGRASSSEGTEPRPSSLSASTPHSPGRSAGGRPRAPCRSWPRSRQPPVRRQSSTGVSGSPSITAWRRRALERVCVLGVAHPGTGPQRCCRPEWYCRRRVRHPRNGEPLPIRKDPAHGTVLNEKQLAILRGSTTAVLTGVQGLHFALPLCEVGEFRLLPGPPLGAESRAR